MQSVAYPFIPTIFPTPPKLQPAKRLPSPVKICRAATNNNTPETHVPVPKLDDAVRDYQFLFVSQRSETVEPVLLRTVDGAIPPDFPSGTYYLTGPGILTDDHGSTVHPLEGHGYLRAFTIDGSSGEVRFSARYVETEAQKEECDRETGRWRFTHRGLFSMLRGGKNILNNKVIRNVANTSVVQWGGRLLCFWEGSFPYEIEPGTLDTVGMFNIMENGDLSPASKFDGDVWEFAAGLFKPILCGVFNMPPKRVLAHYKIDALRDRLLMLSCNAEDVLIPRSHFTFYEFDLNFKLLQKQEFIIPDQLMIHDWAFTDTHYIIFGNRVKVNMTGSMLGICGLSPMFSSFSVNHSKPTSPIYLLPRFSNKITKGRDWRVPIEAPSQSWLLHVANAFEKIDEKGIFEVQIYGTACSYQWINLQKLFGYNWKSDKLDPFYMNGREGEEELLLHLIEVSIKLDANGNYQECSMQPLIYWSRSSEFPTINPIFSGSKNTYIYAATSSGSHQVLPHFPYDTVAKLNISTKSVSTWSVGNRRFIGEPLFIRKGIEEDDGYLLVVEYAVSIQMCYLVVLNPKHIGESDALVARLEVPKHLNFSFGFHGFWAIDK